MTRSRTVAETIRYLQQFDPNDVVNGFTCAPGEKSHPSVHYVDGGLALPQLRWPDDPHSLKLGDRVSKPGYDDTGTIIDPSKRLETRLLAANDQVRAVQWDSTGWSVERIADLGLAVEI